VTVVLGEPPSAEMKARSNSLLEAVEKDAVVTVLPMI
jgi:hypothetical protein